jgi:hypothetical protein
MEKKQMKLNWKTFNVMFALVIAVGAVFWAVNEIRPHSYEGPNLTFSVGDGPVSVTNPSDQGVLVRLIDSGPRTFQVSSTIEGVAGSSTRDRIQNARIHSFEFELPPGTSEFTISNGLDVTFVADTDTQLQATVSPLNSDSRRTTLIVGGVVVLGALFYASRLTRHKWFTTLRRYFSSPHDESLQDTRPTSAVDDESPVRVAQSYSDNRANTGD